jgi:serine/threonine protein kinase
MESDSERGMSGDGRPPSGIPDIELIRRIGEGGFGEVWLATNSTTGQLRAVKVIPLRPAGRTDPASREIMSLIRLEANLRIQHPNLLVIHHVGKTDEHFFYFMDPADDVSGKPASSDPGYEPATLRSRLGRGSLPPEECWRYARQLLAGLACLHEAGMVHRDVKPANCLFVGGELKLGDFGLLIEEGHQISRVGTQPYMPPDGQMGPRADVYAAGLVIYEMLAGQPVSRFPRLGARAPEIAKNPILRALNKIVLRASQPDPQHRFRDAREMLSALAASDPQGLARRRRTRRRIVASMAGVAVASVLAAAIFWVTRPPLVKVNFITHPFEATIFLDGSLVKREDGTPYRTPCTIPDLPARVHYVAFEHDERGMLTAGPIDFTEKRQVEARWVSK